MKKLLAFFTAFVLLFLITPMMGIAQDGEVVDQELSLVQLLLSTTLSAYVITFLAFVAIVTSLSAFINKFLDKKTGWFKQKMSWFVAVAVAMIAFLLNLGIFEPLLWWEALLTGVCGGLVVNGVYDIPAIQELLIKLNLKLPV